MSTFDSSRSTSKDFTDFDATGSLESAMLDNAPDRRGLIEWVRRDPRLTEYCASAVDEFEVAARLETFGLSARVASSSFNYPNVFVAAADVMAGITYLDVRPRFKRGPNMGGPLDLLRGALYAIPAVFVSVVILGLHLSSYWWLLPVGLTISWATTQFFTVLNWSLRDRKDHDSDALLAATSIGTTAVACLVVALVARWTLGGTTTAVAVSVSLGVYVAASSVLVFHSAERLLLVCLIPGFIGSVLSWFILLSGLLVVAMALGPLTSRAWRAMTFSRSTKRQASKFFLYGLGCGLLTSAVIGFASHDANASGSVAIAAGPLLVTLGLMEWQLRTLRSQTSRALRRTSSLNEFARESRTALTRALTIYVGTLALLSAMVVVIAYVKNLSSAPILVLAVDLIGVTFFVALIFVSAGLVNRVLMAWSITFAFLGVELLSIWLYVGGLPANDGITATIAASAVGIVTLTVLARHVLNSPLNFDAQL